MEPLEIIGDRLHALARDGVALTPQIAVAVLVLIATWATLRAAKFAYGTAMRRSKLRRSLIDLFQTLIAVALWIVGTLIAATVLFPTLTPGNLLAGLGLGSIAIGLAFKDIFENFVAGILILLREPMRIGDHITCENVEGSVERITVRDTYIRQTDGQLVLVPNAVLFKNPVFVVTDKTIRRISIACGVAYGEDVDEARAVIERAVSSVDSVRQDQPVQVFAKAFSSSSIDFEVAWWTGSRPLEIRQSRDTVVAAVKLALDKAGIEIPFPYRTLTFKEAIPIRRDPD